MPSVNSKQGNIDGYYGTFQINPASSATFPLPLYTRMKLIANGYIDVAAAATDLADFILYQPGPAVSQWVTCRFINAGGTTFGLSSGTITAGSALYSAINGAVSVTPGTGHLVGRAVSDGTAGNPCIFVPYLESATVVT